MKKITLTVILLVIFLGFNKSWGQTINFTANLDFVTNKITFYPINETGDDYYWEIGQVGFNHIKFYNKNPEVDYNQFIKGEILKVRLSTHGFEDSESNDNKFDIVKNNGEFYITEHGGFKIRFVNDIQWQNGNSNQLAAPLVHRILNSGGEDFHRGIDIIGNEGDPIKAIADGTVFDVVDPSDSSGNLKTLTLKHTMDTPMYFHGKVISTYYSRQIHLADILVTEGQTVEKGQKIAEVGATGLGSGSPKGKGTLFHNHFEMRVGLPKPIEKNGQASQNMFGKEVDPDVNPFLFLENQLNEINSLKYSINYNNSNKELTVLINSNYLQPYFNYIRLKYQKTGTNNITTRTTNLNERMNLPNSNQGSGRYDDFSEEYPDENNINEDITTIGIPYNPNVSIWANSFRNRNTTKENHQIKYKFLEVDKFNPNDNNDHSIIVRDIYGNIAEHDDSICDVQPQKKTFPDTDTIENCFGDCDEYILCDNFDNYNEDDFQGNFLTEEITNKEQWYRYNSDIDNIKIKTPIAGSRKSLHITNTTTNGIRTETLNTTGQSDMTVKFSFFTPIKGTEGGYDTSTTLNNRDRFFLERRIGNTSNYEVVKEFERGSNNFENRGVWYRATVNMPSSNRIRFRTQTVVDNGDDDILYIDNVSIKEITNNLQLAIDEVVILERLQENILYPNPTSNTLFVADDSYLNYQIHNYLGQEIDYGEIYNNSINLSTLSNGMYFIRIIKQDGNSSLIKKIIKY